MANDTKIHNDRSEIVGVSDPCDQDLTDPDEALRKLAAEFRERVRLHDDLTGACADLRRERGKDIRDQHEAAADALEELVRLRAEIQRCHNIWRAEVRTLREVADENLARAERAEAERDELLRAQDTLAGLSAKAISAQDALIAAAYEAAAKLAFERGKWRNRPTAGPYIHCRPDTREEISDAIRALTPADARAALTEGEAG